MVKSKGDEFFWKNNVNIVAVVRKGEMLAASKVKKSGSEQKGNLNLSKKIFGEHI